MTDSHLDKICPILAAFQKSDSVSTGSSWAARCKGDECGWWDMEHACCAVSVIARAVGRTGKSEILTS